MINLPSVAEPLLMSFSIAFTEPTFRRSLVLLVGTILSKGRHTITNLLWNVGDLAEGEPTTTTASFIAHPGRCGNSVEGMATAVIELAAHEDWIRVVVNCTVAEHKGKKVYGKGCHHDSVRSTDNHSVFPLGASVDRAGRGGSLSLLQPSLGIAGADGLVPSRRGQREGTPSAQNTDSTGASG